MSATPVPRVWVLCDSALLAPLLMQLCANAGAEAVILRDADAAVACLAHETSLTLILVELMLGPETGFRAARRLRALCTCPIVILSGTERDSDLAWAPTTGATAVLRYPVSSDALHTWMQQPELAQSLCVS